MGQHGRRREYRRVGIAQHGRLRRRGPWGTVVGFVAAVVGIALVGGIGLVAYAGFDLIRNAHTPVHLIGRSGPPVRDIRALKGGVNIVFAASDTRTGQGAGWGSTDQSAGLGHNDVTLLFHLSQDHSTATVVSFPRDLMIPLPSCPTEGGGTSPARAIGQINSTLDTGGLPCTVLTVEQLTGIETIPYAGVIKFTGVVAMSDAIGGVQVCIGGKGIHDPHTGLNLPPGTATLQGRQATEFLRTRHGVGDGSDLGRISNQMVFLSALVRQVKAAGTLSNPFKVYGLAKAAVSNMILSDGLDNITTLSQIAAAVKNLDLNHVTFVQYPVVTDPENPNRVIPDQQAAATLLDAIRHDRPIAITGGTGDRGQASLLATPSPPATSGTTPSTTGTTDGPSTSDAPAPTPSSPVELPKSIHGQTAATRTCSNGAG